jgi:hypothetical protein
MDRRKLLAALAASTLVPALATPLAWAGTTRVPLADAFLLLEDYLKLPAAKRDRFHLAYLARRGPKPAPDAQAAIVTPDGVRTPLVFSADGELTSLPTLDQLKSKAMFVADGPPFKFALEMRASEAPAAQLEVADLTQTLAQINAAVTTFSEGDDSNRLTTAYFPDAGAGHAVLAAGHNAPLAAFDFPSLGKVLYLDLRRPAATSVQLERPPSRVMFAGPPHA